MALINTADKIYAGATPADKVYAGSNLVWQSGPSYPAVLDTAAAWLDATQDSFTDNQTITSYTSHSAGGRVFTGYGAVKYLASVDGKPRIYFDGASFLKSYGYTPPSSGFTFVLLNRFTAPSPAGIGMPMVYNEDSFNNVEMRINDPSMQAQSVWEYTAGFRYITSSAVETLGRDYLHWLDWNTTASGNARLFVNNVLCGTNIWGLSSLSTPTAALIIGARGASGEYHAVMQVGVCIVFNGVLSDADRNAVSNYLMTSWSIAPLADAPSPLPALPPFVNGAPPT